MSGLMLTFNIKSVKTTPTTWIVDDDGPADFHTIQEAVTAANSGDTIYVYNGTYYETITISKYNLTIIGENPQNTIIDGGGGTRATVWVLSCSKVTLTGFTIRNVTKEWQDYAYENSVVFLQWSTQINIMGNIITEGRQGITSWVCTNSKNSIIGNNISNTLYPIYIHDSSLSNIFRNNFINNTYQVWSDESLNVWNDDYPFGGNYWSDYTGVDLYSGSYQNESGSDGIGDTPYVIDGSNEDRYPLMNPYPCIHAIVVKNISPQKTVLGENSTVEIYVDVLNGHYIETTNLTLYANTTVINTVELQLTTRIFNIPFTWNTTGWIKGRYILSAVATPVPEEANTTDNTCIDGLVTVTILGDVDGDFDVDIYDVVKIAGIYGFVRDDLGFNSNCDLDDDGEITIYDVVMCASHYGETYP